jgi:hypothetical protein
MLETAIAPTSLNPIFSARKKLFKNISRKT